MKAHVTLTQEQLVEAIEMYCSSKGLKMPGAKVSITRKVGFSDRDGERPDTFGAVVEVEL